MTGNRSGNPVNPKARTWPVTHAAGGDPVAWEEIVERYAPLVWSICQRFQLSGREIEDVAQNVWPLLVEHYGRLRDPAALPGWLATTTHRECLRVVTAARRSERAETKLDEAPQFAGDTAIEEEILAAERNAALRAAFAELPPRCQKMLGMLMADPPSSYAEISAALNIPVGSVGPQRARCLDRLRRSDGCSQEA
jgi:RNA polymerase sigma factor (sigma-70 family)